MYFRSVMMTDNEVERYKVMSVSRHEQKAHLYFATLVATGLPDLVLKIQYIKRTYDPGYYKHIEVREGSGKSPVRYHIETALGRKVEDVIKSVDDLQANRFRKIGEV